MIKNEYTVQVLNGEVWQSFYETTSTNRKEGYKFLDEYRRRNPEKLFRLDVRMFREVQSV